MEEEEERIVRKEDKRKTKIGTGKMRRRGEWRSHRNHYGSLSTIKIFLTLLLYDSYRNFISYNTILFYIMCFYLGEAVAPL